MENPFLTFEERVEERLERVESLVESLADVVLLSNLPSRGGRPLGEAIGRLALKLDEARERRRDGAMGRYNQASLDELSNLAGFLLARE